MRRRSVGVLAVIHIAAAAAIFAYWVVLGGCLPDSMKLGYHDPQLLYRGIVRPAVVGTDQDYRSAHALTPDGEEWNAAARIPGTPFWLQKGVSESTLEGNGAIGVSRSAPDYADVDAGTDYHGWSWYWDDARTYRIPHPTPTVGQEVNLAGVDIIVHTDYRFTVYAYGRDVAGELVDLAVHEL